MKRNLYYLFLISIIAASCSGKKDSAAALNDKKGDLQKLKTQQVDLSGKIAQLESEIAKLDTTAIGKPKLVTLETIGQENFTHFVDLQGKIESENIGYVSPRGQGGQVRAVYVKQGQNVRKGQMLVKLDDALVRTQVDQLRPQLAFQQDLLRRQQALWAEGVGKRVYWNLVLNTKTGQRSEPCS